MRNVYPADAVLSLPAVRHSAGLAKLAVIETVRGSFDTALAAISARCGQVIGKRQIEQLVAQAAADVDAFYAARAVLPCTASTVLAISVDGKGIAMRPEALRPATAKAAARARATFRTRLAAGARWGLAGAEAVLKLRALVANGHLEEYWTFHLARQHERIHQTGYPDGYALTA
ncbi:hypothetical protein [Streptosporangium sandarakinum]|uniref:hypothetical protein n=1 Tax=Streptosporangium sandarakinum TaxID=1260955 RepID=UPI0033BDA253